MIQKERIKKLNKKDFQNKKYIVYWMQQSQRTEYNHALEYAISQSNKYEKPLVVYFGLTENFPDANLRHYDFMLEGLKEVNKSLTERNIKFVLNYISPEIGAINLSKKACLLIVDRGYLKIQREWRKNIAEKIKCPLVQIEGDVVVPIEIVSNKEEYAANTIRPRINAKSTQYLIPLKKEKYNHNFVENDLDSTDVEKIVLNKIDNSVKPVNNFKGGTSQAFKHLNVFLKDKIDKYV